jgi:hypothetical protein
VQGVLEIEHGVSDKKWLNNGKGVGKGCSFSREEEMRIGESKKKASELS